LRIDLVNDFPTIRYDALICQRPNPSGCIQQMHPWQAGDPGFKHVGVFK
jgi:hypothetical protein